MFALMLHIFYLLIFLPPPLIAEPIFLGWERQVVDGRVLYIDHVNQVTSD